MKTLLATLILVFACLTTGCWPNIAGDVHVEEVKRLLSPDGKAEAIVQLTDGGATTSRSYSVFIAPKGAKPAEGNRTVTLEASTLPSGDYGIIVSWTSPTTLEVRSEQVRKVFEIRTTVTIAGVAYHVQRKP